MENVEVVTFPSPYLRHSYNMSNQKSYLQFWCPACSEDHLIVYDGPDRSTRPDLYWGFDGNYDSPTFTPSVLVTGYKTVNDENGWTGEWVKDASGNPVPKLCHTYVTAGQINYLGDCQHDRANSVAALPPKWQKEYDREHQA